MQSWHRGRLRDAAGWALAMLVSTSPAAAQDFAGREKLRAHGEQEFRKDIVKVTDSGGATVFAGTDRPEIYSHQLFVDRVPDVGRAGRDAGDMGSR